MTKQNIIHVRLDDVKDKKIIDYLNDLTMPKSVIVKSALNKYIDEVDNPFLKKAPTNSVSNNENITESKIEKSKANQDEDRGFTSKF